MKSSPPVPASIARPLLHRGTRGFTLIELLAVVAILGVLAALSAGVVGRAINNAHTTTTISRLKQLHVANVCYAADHDGWYVQNFDGWWSNPWKADRNFLGYLGWKGVDPWADPSKVTHSGFPEASSMIAYNIVKAPHPSGGSSHFWDGQAMRLQQMQIEKAGALIAFADSNDWWMSPDAWNNWASRDRHDKDHSNGNAMIAYRNAGKAAAITFAGNVLMLSRAELDPGTPEGGWRWYYNGRKWD